MKEIYSMRGQRHKTFLLDDGSYRSVNYKNPVHYFDRSIGMWKDIKLSIKENIGDYSLDELPSKVKIPKNILQEDVVIRGRDDPYEIKTKMLILDSDSELSITDSFISKNNESELINSTASTNRDINPRFVASREKMKFEVEMLSKKNLPSVIGLSVDVENLDIKLENYNFTEEYYKNLEEPYLDEEGFIVTNKKYNRLHPTKIGFYSKITKKKVWEMSSPFFYDRNRNRKEIPLRVLVNSGNYLFIGIDVPNNWILREDVELPVVMDPTFSDWSNNVSNGGSLYFNVPDNITIQSAEGQFIGDSDFNISTLQDSLTDKHIEFIGSDYPASYVETIMPTNPSGSTLIEASAETLYVMDSYDIGLPKIDVEVGVENLEIGNNTNSESIPYQTSVSGMPVDIYSVLASINDSSPSSSVQGSTTTHAYSVSNFTNQGYNGTVNSKSRIVYEYDEVTEIKTRNPSAVLNGIESVYTAGDLDDGQYTAWGSIPPSRFIIGAENEFLFSIDGSQNAMFQFSYEYTVDKDPQPAPSAPTLSSLTSNSITLNVIADAYYRVNDGSWQASNIFSGLSPATEYKFEAYYPETSTHFASNPSSSSYFTTDKGSRTTPAPPNILMATESTIVVQDYGSDARYRINGGAWQTSRIFGGLVPMTSYSIEIYYVESSIYYESPISDTSNITTDHSLWVDGNKSDFTDTSLPPGLYYDVPGTTVIQDAYRDVHAYVKVNDVLFYDFVPEKDAPIEITIAEHGIYPIGMNNIKIEFVNTDGVSITKELDFFSKRLNDISLAGLSDLYNILGMPYIDTRCLLDMMPVNYPGNLSIKDFIDYL